ncbi:hypothetical protein QFC22_001079 [Naganishia vaughanmartiniae]|uniref:Uncharacterized protein n=1 Tax=Naganishia vaughanmartiniae TaxID=1424756 RepID=A0ACC2XLG4_9TREE|nr:hypothetical protein QFC22_001079 [Naganishia vaughanmartiniae]
MPMNDNQYLQPTLATPHDSYITFPNYSSHTTDDSTQQDDLATTAAQTTFDELPIVVPSYPTCPHKEVIREDQVEEWVGRRALEFAFTRHGERRSAKKLSTSTATNSLPHLDPTLTRPSTSVDAYQTLHSALVSHAPPSPTMQEIESLGAAAAASVHDGIINHTLSPLTLPLPVAAQGSPTPSSNASTIERKPRAGAAQYESIIEYRCCWSGSYRPRAYENKTGQKRQRAPSTKVGCKAKFVIRKVAKTGLINVTYHCKRVIPAQIASAIVLTFTPVPSAGLHNGHDPTDIEQIKRMRSAQLPETIKKYLRGRQEAEAERVQKDRAANGVGSSTGASRKRKRVEEVDGSGSGAGDGSSSRGLTLPARNRMTMFVDPSLAGMISTTTEYSHSPVDLQVSENAPHMSSGQDQSTHHNGFQAQDQHQQMLALIPAPSNGASPAQVTMIDGSFLPQVQGVDSGSFTAVAAIRWSRMNHQQQVAQVQVQPLSDVRTPTATVLETDQTAFPENERQLSDAPLMNGTLVSPSPPLTLNEFRQGVNTSLLGLHALVEELQQFPPDLPLTIDNSVHRGDGEGAGQVRAHEAIAMMVDEGRETIRLGEEFVRRVTEVIRSLGEDRRRVEEVNPVVVNSKG